MKRLINYSFFSDRRSGIFIGLDQFENTTNYYTRYHIYQGSEPIDNLNRPYFNLEDTNKVNAITYGARFYLPAKKNSLFSNLGFGFKGWYGITDVSVYRPFYDLTLEKSDFYIKFNVASIGYEGQMYYDFLNFTTSKIHHSIGLTLGVGTETKAYNNYSFNDEQKSRPGSFDQLTDFKLDTLIYDVALHYTFANRFRFEIGYKKTDYNSNAQAVSNFGYDLMAILLN